MVAPDDGGGGDDKRGRERERAIMTGVDEKK
jgi:hypothetical protein